MGPFQCSVDGPQMALDKAPAQRNLANAGRDRLHELLRDAVIGFGDLDMQV